MLLLFLAVFLFFSFVLFSYLVAKEIFTKFDFDITVKFQDNISRRFDYIFSVFSLLGMVETTGIIWLFTGAYLLIKRYWLALLSLGLLPLALALEVFGKVFLYHPAPPHLFYRGVLDVTFPSHFVHTNYSYPSGHMLRTAYLITFFILFLYFRTGIKRQLFLGSLLLGIFVVMTISRIYLAEHWTTDVIGGALLGASCGILSALFIPSKKPGHSELVSESRS